MKNAAPMYAFTLKKLQNPIPINTKSKRVNMISSSRNRHFSSLCSSAFIATEKTAERRKIAAPNNTLCVKVSDKKEKGIT